jgi:hypothetical protein
MKLFSALTVIAIAAAGPALAEAKCATGPKSKWQPKSALETQLQAEGYKVRQIKAEGGCYEVYATDKDGKRDNMAYNVETLEKLSNGIVTLPWGEREASAVIKFSGCCDGGPPCVHRHSPKCAVRLD